MPERMADLECSDWRNGLPRSRPKTRPRSSKMSRNWCWLVGRACAISSSTKVSCEMVTHRPNPSTLPLLQNTFNLDPSANLPPTYSVYRHEGGLPPLRLALLHRRNRPDRQRTHHARNRAPLRGADGQILRQRLRTRHHLQLPESLLHPR